MVKLSTEAAHFLAQSIRAQRTVSELLAEFSFSFECGTCGSKIEGKIGPVPAEGAERNGIQCPGCDASYTVRIDN